MPFFGIEDTSLGGPIAGFDGGFKFGNLGRRGQVLGKKDAVGIPLGQVFCGGAVLPRNPGGINELKTKDVIWRSSGPRLGLDTLRDEH